MTAKSGHIDCMWGGRSRNQGILAACGLNDRRIKAYHVLVESGLDEGGIGVVDCKWTE